MKSLLLVSDIDIVKQIFTLVAKKLSINFTIIDNPQAIDDIVDIIAIDEQENNIDYTKYAKDILYLGDSSDYEFVLNKPFLPSQLQNILELIYTKQNSTTSQISTTSNDGVEELISFVSDMTDEIEPDKHNDYNQLEDDDENLIIRKEDLGSGGVLDKDELSKLYTLVNDEDDDEISQQEEDDEENWVDLSNIIDQAIDDISEYEFDTQKPIKLILNKYSITELSTLFNKLDQNIIDSLTDGKDILLQLRLEK